MAYTLLNGQPLPQVGTMFTNGTLKLNYYEDKELTRMYVNAGRPDYPIEVFPFKGWKVGIYTGNYHAVNGVLFSVQVDWVSTISDSGEFGQNIPRRHWVFTNLEYDAATQGELPVGYGKDENGALVFDYSQIQQTHIDPKTGQKKLSFIQKVLTDTKTQLLILASLIILLVLKHNAR